MLGVLQTWTRDMRYHPHIHYLVPGVGLTADGCTVQPPGTDFLVPVKPLAQLFRAKLRAALVQTALKADIPERVWQTDWVVDCRPVGNGHTALKYLAPYIFRIALSNQRIVMVQNGQVTFRYTERTTRQTRTRTLPAVTFLHQFLQHMLPAGFVKVRYYGLFRHGNRAILHRIRGQLALARGVDVVAVPLMSARARQESGTVACPSCGHAMQLTQHLAPRNRGPPVPKRETNA